MIKIEEKQKEIPKSELIKEAIEVLEERKGKLCFQQYKLKSRIEALQSAIDEIKKIN